MENPEKDILKNLLQDTFSDWEPEPSEQTWHTIQQAIQPPKAGIGGLIRRWFLPIVGLLLLGGSLFIQHISPVNGNETTFITAMSSRKTDMVSNLLPIQAKEQVRTLDEKSSIISAKEVATIHTINYSKPIAGKGYRQAVVSRQKVSPKISIHTVNQTIQTNQSVAVTPAASSIRVRTPLEKGKSLGTNSLSTANDMANSSPVAVENQVSKPMDLEELSEKQLFFAQTAMALPLLHSISVPQSPKPVRKEHFLSLSITPIQTYRIFTVTNKDVQKLQKNSLFNAERNGFAVELGVNHPIRKDFYLRGGLSYLNMQQWVQYQVTTDEVLVNNSKTSTAIETILATKVESKTMQMLGIKADFQKFIRTSDRNRYFLSLGPQIMYDPENKKTNVFINASAGFQHTINPNYFITIEPIASYSLNSISDKNSLIQTNVYNVGVKMGLSFRCR